MRTGAVMLAGSLAALLGGVFHLQGLGVIGPESSFMYSNREWVDYGVGIAAAGTAAAVAGALAQAGRRRSGGA